MDLNVDDNIATASTISAKFYQDKSIFETTKDLIFARSWQFLGDLNELKAPGSVIPRTLLEGFLDEPILLTRNFDDELNCMANVCTHRGFKVIEKGGNERNLRCRYHGRKYTLNGKFESMPEFEKTENFPTESDNLPAINFRIWKNLIFVNLARGIDFDKLIVALDKRIGWLPIQDFTFTPSLSRDYLVRANWALYCDNYLEGFHIPYVHSSLNEALDYRGYTTELFELSNLQLGIADGAEETFELPQDSQDYGKNIAAYYFWVWTNMMFNFYPWGLSINIIEPIDVNRTKVRFLTYMWKSELYDKGAGSGLDRVEREDENVVELVQKGISSRFYNKGRFSPTQEQGVHQFHTLISRLMKNSI
ncbi:MAG: aromatic ring-hydroxylating dioxygenase subunit alpha [Candidatus Heimdallarchaeota archaeon]|nr:aromatic ring-hydroxylating dioxygenase subunit alpha [Candidatus Heimdallarchaeota archaeon]